MNPYLKDRDILDNALEHSWGKSAEAKARERAYNREYYQRHKEEILRKARQAGEGIQRTAQNAYNQARDTAQNAYNQASKFTGQYRTSTEQRGTANKNKMYAKTWNTFHKMMNYVPDKDMDEYMKKGGYTDQDIKDFHENRKYVNQFTRQQYRQRGTAANEAAKAARNSDPTRRTINNAKAGARDVINNARDYIDTVTGKKGEHANTQSTADVSRYEKARNTYDGLHRDAMDRANAQSTADVSRYEKMRDMNDRRYSDAKARANTAETERKRAEQRGNLYLHETKAAYKKAGGDAGLAREGLTGVETPDMKRAREYASATAREADKIKNAQGDYDRATREQHRFANRMASSGAAYNEAAKAYANATRDPHRYANRRASSAAAANEAAKAYANAERGYDARYDTKLGRDLQNAYSKVRRTGRESKQALDNAMNTAKSTLTKAQKEALKKREEAKRRMQKWFKR